MPSSNILVTKKGTLRVYFVSVGDYDANVGTFGTWQTPQWTAQIPEATSALLAKQIKIPAEDIPDDVQVETFVDNDFPRPAADDIYFTKRRVALAPAPAPKPTNASYLAMPVFAAGLLAVARRRRSVV